MSSDYLPCWVAFVLFLYFDGLSLKVRFREREREREIETGGFLRVLRFPPSIKLTTTI
jgi:hypothetical protein